MHPPRFFCSQASQANHEAVFGTVARIRSWFLLEYSNVWRHDALEDSTLISPEIKKHIQGFDADRTLLIRQEHQPRHPVQAFFVESREETRSIRRHCVEDYGKLAGVTPESTGEPVSSLMFAVCTHGRHDKCCAKFGIPVWCALRDVAGARAWQCSHVGGDRFAANLVVLPYGIYYGHVTPADVPEIVRRSDAGEVWLPGYRGRSCFQRPVQVADYFARRESGELGIDAFRFVRADTSQVVLQHTGDGRFHRVRFATRTDAFRQRLTCSSEEESPVTQYELLSYTISASSG